MERIDAASNLRTEELVASLGEEETRLLVENLRSAERILEKRSTTPPVIERAESSTDIATARVLMREYAAFLGADLSFQGFEKELAGLPGKYDAPAGAPCSLPAFSPAPVGGAGRLRGSEEAFTRASAR